MSRNKILADMASQVFVSSMLSFAIFDAVTTIGSSTYNTLIIGPVTCSEQVTISGIVTVI